MTRWSISAPPSFSERSLRGWVDEMLREGIPRGVISFWLLSAPTRDLSLDELQATLRVQDEASSVMVDRNLQGIEYEKASRTDDAIGLYEANVADWFDGSHPYDRLRILYKKSGKRDDAVRVCEAFVAVADELAAMGSPRDLEPQRAHFKEWAEKLRASSS